MTCRLDFAFINLNKNLRIVQKLVESDFDASMELENKTGTKFTIKFNIKSQKWKKAEYLLLKMKLWW